MILWLVIWLVEYRCLITFISLFNSEQAMDLEMKINGIEIRKVCDEYSCVAAKKRFRKGDVIEVCPTVAINKRDSYFVEETKLITLCYQSNKKLFLTGGYAGFYFPSENHNAIFEILPKQRALVITANKTIKPGEFIYVDSGTCELSKPKENYNKPSCWHSDGLIVKSSPDRGLGTFTTKKFKKGEFVEVSGLLCLTEKESWLLSKTNMNGFMFTRGSRGQLSGWATGYPCFYNHSKNPNVDPHHQIRRIKSPHLAVKALKDLKPGTEILFDYGWEEKDLGFKMK